MVNTDLRYATHEKQCCIADMTRRDIKALL